jgi:hypothetical protein
MSLSRFAVHSLLIGALCLHAFDAGASSPKISPSHRDDAATRVPAALAVQKTLGPPPAGVTELKFRDLFKLPVGPKGLEPTEKLLALDGKRVRIVGYMVRQSPAPKGLFLLSPLPATLGDEDESLADDLPPTTLAISLDKSRELVLPMLPGLLQISGTLHVGMRTDPATGRAMPAEIVLDEAPQRALRTYARELAAKAKKRIQPRRLAPLARTGRSKPQRLRRLSACNPCPSFRVVSLHSSPPRSLSAPSMRAPRKSRASRRRANCSRAARKARSSRASCRASSSTCRRPSSRTRARRSRTSRSTSTTRRSA